MGKAESFLRRQNRKITKDPAINSGASCCPSPDKMDEKRMDSSNESKPSVNECLRNQEFRLKTEHRTSLTSPLSVAVPRQSNKIAFAGVTPKRNSPILYVVFGVIALIYIMILGINAIKEDGLAVNNESVTATNPTDSIFCIIVKGKNNGISVGSGFAVDGKNIITNKHVVIDSSESRVLVHHPNWSKPKIAIIKEISQSFDLAWLCLDSRSDELIPLVLSQTMAKQGEKVYTFGYPGYSYEQSNSIPQITMSDGIIKANQRTIDRNPCYETSATINGGNSGGPLMNSSMQVIGINTFSLKTEIAANCFYAIRVETIKIAFPTLWSKIQ